MDSFSSRDGDLRQNGRKRWMVHQLGAGVDAALQNLFRFPPSSLAGFDLTTRGLQSWQAEMMPLIQRPKTKSYAPTYTLSGFVLTNQKFQDDMYVLLHTSRRRGMPP
jgi:hypothetical protein